MVPLLVDEPTSSACRRFWDDADTVVACRLLYVEATAALAQAERSGRLTAREHSASLRRLNDLWQQIDLIEIDDTLTRRTAVLASRFALRGYDAVHCASAEQINGSELVAAAGDARLLQAWRRLEINTFDPNATTADVSALKQRLHDRRPIFGLPAEVSGRRWVARDGGPGDLALAHGEARPHASPLITVGTLRHRFDRQDVRVDVHDTLGTFLMLAERSRNDPAFQHATRDSAVIERKTEAVQGPDAWRPFEIDLDGVPTPFQRLDRGDDWIAFHDFGDECLYVHAEQPDGSPVSIVTLTDITSYEDIG